MNVTTINITTVRLSNTESEVNYESDQFANRASSPCMQWCGGEPLILIQCSPNRAGRFPITRLTNLIFRAPGKIGTIPLSFATQVYAPRPLLPFPNERVHRPPGESWRTGLPLWWFTTEAKAGSRKGSTTSPLPHASNQLAWFTGSTD